MPYKNARVLYVVAFADLFAVSLIVPLMSAHLRSLNASHFFIGLMSTTYSALQLLSSPIAGSWSDVKGHRSSLLLTLSACAVFYLLLGSTSYISLIFLARFLLGVFKHTQTLCKALVADIIPHTYHQDAYGKLNAVGGVGFVLGPAVGGHLAETNNGFLYVSCIAAFTFCVNTGVVYWLVPEHTTAADTSHTSDNKPQFAGVGAAFSQLRRALKLLRDIEWTHYWDVFTLKFALVFSQSLFFFMYSLYVQEAFNVGQRVVGYTISFQSIIGTVCSLSVGALNRFYDSDERYNRQMFHFSLVLSVSFLCLSLASSFPLFLLSLVPLSASGAVLRVAGTEALVRCTAPDRRASVMGSSNSVASVARLLAPLCAGALRDTAGVRGVFALAQVAALGGAVLAFWLLTTAPSRQKKQQ